MPMKKNTRSGTRRKTYKKRYARKTYKKTNYIARTPTVHSFKRMASPTQLVGNIAYNPYLGTEGAAFNNLVGSGDFTTLFDQYRITYVILRFYLKIDPSAQAAASASYPKIYYMRDLDDATTPVNLNEIRESQSARVKVLWPNRPVTIRVKVNTLQMLYSSAVVTQYKPVWNQWLDMSTTASTHFGIKYGIDDLTNTNYKVDIERTYYFQCRNSR